MADDELRAQLYERLKREILDQAATWEETFDAGPGEVVSVSDAASVAARVLTPTDEQLRDELAAAIEARVKVGTFTPDPFGGAIGSFFGATCHDLADVPLALVGARVAQLEAEVARLRAGEADEFPPEGVELTAAQFIRKWNDATPEQRLKVATRALKHSGQESRCFKLDHDARLQEAERQEHEARKAMLTLVKAAGGRVRIPERILIETGYDAEVLTMQHDRVTGDVICEARGGANEAGRNSQQPADGTASSDGGNG